MIGILTGTFDPIHEGHILTARAALEQCRLQEVWFLVNPDPSHKLCQASFEDRLEMVRLSLAGQSGLRLAPLSPEQIRRPHTLATFRDLLAAFPADDFRFVVGMDTLERLDTWKDVESVVESTAYIAIHRPGTPAEGLSTLRQRLGALGDRLQVEVIDAATPSGASSTVVRRQLSAGESAVDVPTPAAEYIRDYHLYR